MAAAARLWIGLAAAAVGASGELAAHGPKSKPFFNVSKANASTRGGAGSSAAQLYMMQPPRHSTARHELAGIDIILRDEDSSTVERFDVQVVRATPSGAPDESPGGLIRQYTFHQFGFLSGPQTFIFNLTVGLPVLVPERFGLGLRLPAAPSWPARDGLSVVAQLNLAGDPNRPRVPAQHAGEVWAYERLPSQAAATPLGGRTLDTLALSGAYTGSVLQGIVHSSAYGGAPEPLLGPESLYPVAARGDTFSIFAHANNPSFPYLLLWLSPQQISPPWCCHGPPNSVWYLSLDPPFPLLLTAAALDPFGQGTFGPLPIRAFPPGLRSFWVQGAVVSAAFQVELTDAIGFEGS